MLSSAQDVAHVLPKPNPKSIRYVSFDLDGCIFNKNFKTSEVKYDLKKEFDADTQYLQARSGALIKANAGLLNTIIDEIKKDRISELKLMVGSNRQDLNTDGLNATNNRVGSLASAMLGIEGYFKKNLNGERCELDKYLLADSFGGKKPGTAFDLIAKDRKGESKEHDTAIVDEYKWLLVFAQTHKAASDNLFSNVIFDLYDDHRSNLRNLSEFYAANPDLLPENLTLRLHYYDGDNCEFINEIKGNTKSIKKYGEGVMQMLKCGSVSDSDIKNRKFDQWSFYQAYRDPQVLSAFKNELKNLQGVVIEKEVVREVVAAASANNNNVDLVDNELSQEVQNLNNHITELKRKYPHPQHAGTAIDELINSLVVARDAISEDFKRMHLNNFTQKKINNSSASVSLAMTEKLLVKLSHEDPLVHQEGLNEFVTALQHKTKNDKFTKILWGIAIVAACFVVGAGVGFAAGLGIGAATGPGAIFTAVGGALVGAMLAAVIGAGVGGGIGAALGGTFFGRFVHKKGKDEAPVNNSMQDVSRKLVALKAG